MVGSTWPLVGAGRRGALRVLAEPSVVSPPKKMAITTRLRPTPARTAYVPRPDHPPLSVTVGAQRHGSVAVVWGVHPAGRRPQMTRGRETARISGGRQIEVSRRAGSAIVWACRTRSRVMVAARRLATITLATAGLSAKRVDSPGIALEHLRRTQGSRCFRWLRNLVKMECRPPLPNGDVAWPR